ncbi:mitochondrial carrier domain-containing protein [Mycena crocata]|nr:mitochondrial carrier domain-containing protein [Mycena crocata]
MSSTLVRNDSGLNALAGATGGVVAMIGTYPLNILSTRAAVETNNESEAICRNVLGIVKRKGVLGLYPGLKSSLLGIAITNGVYYYFYEGSRDSIFGGKQALSATESIFAALFAGCATTIVANPIWVVQTAQVVYDLKNPTSKEPGIIETTKLLVGSEGIWSLWRGFRPALVLVINPIIQYTVFEQLKSVLMISRTRQLSIVDPAVTATILSDYDYFLLGALSKFVATGITYPYIVVKNRLQAGENMRGSVKYILPLDELGTIVREEGVSGLYKGVGTKLIQSMLAAAILFAAQRRIFELTKRVMLPLLEAE